MNTIRNQSLNQNLFLIAITFIFCALTGIKAQQQNLTSPTTVTSITYFELGDTKKYHVTETNEKFKNNAEKPTKSTSNSYDLAFKVVGAADSSYTIEMTYTNSQCDISTGKKAWDTEELTNSLNKLTNNMTVRYKTNEMGIFDTILNLPELSTKMGQAMDLLIKEMNKMIDEKEKDKSANGEAKKMINQILGNMKKSFTKLENVEVLFLDDIISMHSIYGFEMTLNKPDDMEIYYNLFDDQTVMGVGKLALTGINKTGDDCRIEMTEQPNKEEMKKFLSEIANSFIEGTAEEKTDPKDFKMDANTKLTYVMSLSTGWMKKITIVNKNNVTIGKTSAKTIKKQEYKLL